MVTDDLEHFPSDDLLCEAHCTSTRVATTQETMSAKSTSERSTARNRRRLRITLHRARCLATPRHNGSGSYRSPLLRPSAHVFRYRSVRCSGMRSSRSREDT